jgi:hypothetical protein
MGMQKKTTGRAGREAAPAPVFSQNPLEVVLPDPMPLFGDGREGRLVVVFRAATIGDADGLLADQLLREYLQALIDHPEPPLALLFYASGVRLTLDGSPVLDHLRSLLERGTDLLACRSSLSSIAPGRQPAVGRAAPLAHLIDQMRQAHVLLWP